VLYYNHREREKRSNKKQFIGGFIMRKIEKQIINTVKQLNGTEQTVRLSARDLIIARGNTVDVYLWGNKIATIEFCKGSVLSVAFCFCGYLTNTTKSRLNAILTELLPYPVFCRFKSGTIQCLNGQVNEIDPEKWYKISADNILSAI
jgi:hypothetical protein